MEKVYEARVTAAEAARLLLTFSARAFVWSQDNNIMAETLSDRKMVLVNLALSSNEYAFIIDESLFNSENFWSSAFWGMDKCRFNNGVEVDWDDIFDITEAELIGDTSPGSFDDDEYMEPDYGDMCNRLGVTPVNLEAEKAEELKELQPLVDDGTISDYDAECAALAMVNRIDREDLKDWELRRARIKAVVYHKKWDVLNEYERKIGEKFPEPIPQPVAKRPRKPQTNREMKKAPRRRKD